MGAQWHDFGTLKPETKLDVYKTGLLAAGGVWALFIYRRTRKGKATVRISGSARLHRPSRREYVLLIRLTMTNVSAVLCREVQATVTLFSASQRTPAGSVDLLAFAEQDPLVNLAEQGRIDPRGIVLEPGESIDSEMAFVLNRLELLAMRVLVSGKQSMMGGFYDWNGFFYLDPESIRHGEKPLTSAHSNGGQKDDKSPFRFLRTGAP